MGVVDCRWISPRQSLWPVFERNMALKERPYFTSPASEFGDQLVAMADAVFRHVRGKQISTYESAGNIADCETLWYTL
jgi:hypothetical protein